MTDQLDRLTPPVHAVWGAPAAPPVVPPTLLTKRDLWASRRYRGIACWSGLPGSGKTYELARWGLEQGAAGRQVWCSFGFNLPGCRIFRSVEEFVAIPNGSAICVDEAPIWFDARAWGSMDPTVLVRLTQIRKYDIVMRYTAIDPTMVELRLRQITFDWLGCKAIGRRGPFNSIRKLASPDGAPKLRDEDGAIRIRKMQPAVCMAYDTSATADTTTWLTTEAKNPARRRR